MYKSKSECLGLGFCFVGMSSIFSVLYSFIFFRVFFLGLLEQSYNGDDNCFGLDFLFDCLGIGVCCDWFGFFDLVCIEAIFVW